MSTSGDCTIGAQPAATRAKPAVTVLSAYSGKVYACCVSVDVAMSSARRYAARPEDLLALGVCDSWRSHADARGIAVMRVS